MARQPSFRDPAGNVYLLTEQVIRHVHPEAEDAFMRFANTNEFARFYADGRLITHAPLAEGCAEVVGLLGDAAPSGGRWLQHPRIPFISYPAEWTFGMLKAAAALTLELAEAALAGDLELKDATPRNVLFKGGVPVFVDILSFRAFPGKPVWDAYHQCLRTFILPLLFARDFGLRLDRVFLCDREGLSIEESYRLLGPLKRLRSPYRNLVAMPRWLSRSSLSLPVPALDSGTAKSLSLRRIRGLRRIVDGCARPEPKSTWTDYDKIRNYERASLDEKRKFTDKALDELPSGAWVLDLGANTGEFSLAANQKGLQVVAVDSDEACMDRLYSEVGREQLNILPLVVNLGRPTPASGWGLKEEESFLERAAGRFDLVLALALVHHLRFAEGAPLAMQVKLFWSLTRKWVLLEWVDPKDTMVQSLINRFGFVPEDYTLENLERSLSGYFLLRSRVALEGGTRCLLLLEKTLQAGATGVVDG